MTVGAFTDASGRQEFPGQEIFLTPLVNSACQFLEESWSVGLSGDISKGEAGIYYTYLTVFALNSIYSDKHPESARLRHRLAELELGGRNLYSNNISMLSLVDAAYLLELFRIQPASDQDFLEILERRVQEQMLTLLEHPHKIRFRSFAVAVRALCQQMRGANFEIIKNAVSFLISVQNINEGGWPDYPDGESSSIATALIVEALRGVPRLDDLQGASACIRRAERYLQEKIAAVGWHKIGAGGDPFAQATVLRAIAVSADPEIVESGLAALKSAAGDRGWGLAAQHLATVEATAVVLLAFAACHENWFVPYRIAAAKVGATLESLSGIQAELKKFKEDFNRQLVTESGKILADRDKWRSDAQNLQREKVDLEERLRGKEREAFEEERRYRDVLRMAEFQLARSSVAGRRILGLPTSIWVVSVSVFVGGAASALITIFPRIAKDIGGLALADAWTVGGPVIAVIAGMIGFFVYRSLSLFLETRRVFKNTPEFSKLRPSSIRDLEPVTFAVQQYYDLMSQTPPSVREELGYILTTRVTDMPEDVGRQYVWELLDRFRLPSELRELIMGWVFRFLSMDSYMRRAVAEQIRRHSL